MTKCVQVFGLTRSAGLPTQINSNKFLGTQNYTILWDTKSDSISAAKNTLTTQAHSLAHNHCIVHCPYIIQYKLYKQRFLALGLQCQK